MGISSISPGELEGLSNILRAGHTADGRRLSYAPRFFPEDHVVVSMRKALVEGRELSSIPYACKLSLARQRVNARNFYNFADPKRPLNQKKIEDFLPEVEDFLARVTAQAAIWVKDRFPQLGLNEEFQRFFLKCMSLVLPVLFVKGFPDHTDHSQQVASMMGSLVNEDGADFFGILMAILVGACHDPKLEKLLDIMGKNLMTHPAVAAAMAHVLFQHDDIKQTLLVLFRGNQTDMDHFIKGVVDVLAMNDDSPFVVKVKIAPEISDAILKGGYEKWVAHEVVVLLTARLEALSKGQKPPPIDDFLLGVLEDVKLDSGLLAVSIVAWEKALAMNGIKTDNPARLFTLMLDGKAPLSTEQILQLKEAIIKTIPNGIISAKVRALTLFHSQDEVYWSAKRVGKALGATDQIQLESDKIDEVLDCEMYLREDSFINSYDSSICNLSPRYRETGQLFQRGKYCMLIGAHDLLTLTSQLKSFYEEHQETPLIEDIDHSRKICQNRDSLGKFAEEKGWRDDNPNVDYVISLKRICRNALYDQYRDYIIAGKDLAKFKYDLEVVRQTLIKLGYNLEAVENP